MGRVLRQVRRVRGRPPPSDISRSSVTRQVSLKPLLFQIAVVPRSIDPNQFELFREDEIRLETYLGK